MNPATFTSLAAAAPLHDPRYGTVFELAGFATGLPHLGLALVEVRAGATSPLHYHDVMSEVYYVVSGNGMMQLDGNSFAVGPGDCISIQPGTRHAIRADVSAPLTLLVATSPAYDEQDDIEVGA